MEFRIRGNGQWTINIINPLNVRKWWYRKKKKDGRLSVQEMRKGEHDAVLNRVVWAGLIKRWYSSKDMFLVSPNGLKVNYHIIHLWAFPSGTMPNSKRAIKWIKWNRSVSLKEMNSVCVHIFTRVWLYIHINSFTS